MTKPTWLNKQVFGWAMFDFANQAFTLVILTAVFSVYFQQHVAPEGQGVYYWSAAGIITQVLIIFLAPVLGALADFSGAKKLLLLISWIGCVIFTASLALIPPGGIVVGMILFIIAYLFYAGGENFMASFLPELAPHRVMGRVSAFGWTMGYVGGLLCLGGAAGIVLLWSEPTNYRIVSVWAAVFFFAGAVPTFLFLDEKKKREPMPAGQNYFTIGFHRLAQTYREVRSYRHLFQYLAIMTAYFAGVQTVFWFAGILTRELFDFSQQKSVLFLLQITLTAILGAVLAIRFQDRLGTRNFLLVSLAFWTVTVFAAALARQEWMFWIVGNAVGIGIGAIGTASRAMVGLFSPQYKAAEFFGFYGLAHKLAAIIGLASIAGMMALFASIGVGEDARWHLVVGCGTVFFIIGFILMWKVDERAGRTAALRAEKAFQRRSRAALD